MPYKEIKPTAILINLEKGIVNTPSLPLHLRRKNWGIPTFLVARYVNEPESVAYQHRVF